MPKTKCKVKKDAKLKILSKKLIPNISISFSKKINKEKINIIFLIFIIILILSIVFSLIFICIKIHMIKGYNEKVTLEDNMKII